MFMDTVRVCASYTGHAIVSPMSLLIARPPCGICFFCLDVGCRRVLLRYRVNECVKYMFMDTVCVCVSVCVLDILGMQLYRLFAYDCVTCASF